MALGEVEDDVGRERLEPRDEERGRPGHVDGLDAVAGAGQGPLDAGDGLGGVELGFLFGVGDAEVVREGDAHGGRWVAL